jgi:hypothetical protein
MTTTLGERALQKGLREDSGNAVRTALGSAGCFTEVQSRIALRRKGLYKPVVLNSGLNEAVEQLLHLNREKVYAQDAPCQEAGQAVWPDFAWVLVSGQPTLLG